MFLLKFIRIQTNKLSSAKKIITFVVTPSENYGIFCHFWGYDKGFYGIIFSIIESLLHSINERTRKGASQYVLDDIWAKVDEVASGDNLQIVQIVIDVYDPLDQLLSVERKIENLRA